MAEEYHFREWRIRADMVAALERYVEHGKPVGDFLRAVLSNNFSEAVGRADEDNARNLPAYAGYMYNEMPMGSHGSKANYDAWTDKFYVKLEE